MSLDGSVKSMNTFASAVSAYGPYHRETNQCLFTCTQKVEGEREEGREGEREGGREGGREFKREEEN